MLAKFFGKKQILYFLLFILSIITYLVATFLGLGMILGIVFIWMSTNYTGQVINIELPLGLIIIGFYLGYGAGIYRKRHLNKR